MVDWKIEDVVPYLYSSVGYKTSVFHVKNDDRTKALYAYINTNAFENATNRDKFIEDYKQLILEGEEDLYCPLCGNKLVTRVLKRYDIEDNLVFDPKAHCSKCVFQIK